jgi:hypothetical protein
MWITTAGTAIAERTNPIEYQQDDTTWDSAEQWNDPPPF